MFELTDLVGGLGPLVRYGWGDATPLAWHPGTAVNAPVAMSLCAIRKNKGLGKHSLTERAYAVGTFAIAMIT